MGLIHMHKNAQKISFIFRLTDNKLYHNRRNTDEVLLAPWSLPLSPQRSFKHSTRLQMRRTICPAKHYIVPLQDPWHFKQLLSSAVSSVAELTSSYPLLDKETSVQWNFTKASSSPHPANVHLPFLCCVPSQNFLQSLDLDNLHPSPNS